MKKFVALFTDSYRELKSVRTITTMAMHRFFEYPERNHCLPVWTDGWRHFFRNA